MKLAIADGHRVTIHYRLTLDDGTVAKDSFGGKPIAYVHGTNNMIPGLERELTGKSVGDESEVQVAPADGYGDYDSSAEHTMPRSQFPPNVDLQPGVSFRAEDPQGPIMVWVCAIDGDHITITSNHPLSGKHLNYKVLVVDVSDTSAEPNAASDP